MQIRIRESGAVVYENEFRAMYPDTSFPAVLSVDLLNDFGADPVLNGPYPTAEWDQVVVYDGVVEVDGQWFTSYSVRDMTPEELAIAEDERKQANKTQASTLLQATDWTEVLSVSDPANIPYLQNVDAFVAYRVELRAIAVNPPVTVDPWPVKPDEVWS
jgi:hypothetical protein